MATQKIRPGYRNTLGSTNRLGRLVWGVVWALLYRPTPRWALDRWRLSILHLFGAKTVTGTIRPTCRVWAPWNLTLGRGVAIDDDVFLYCVAPIRIGVRAVVSREAFLCTATHDIQSASRELTAKEIVIGDYAWIAARAFVGPGVTIGEGAVVGACAVVTKDVEPWTVVAGNPAKVIKKREILYESAIQRSPAQSD